MSSTLSTHLCQSISSLPSCFQTQAARQRSVAFRWDSMARLNSGGSWDISGKEGMTAFFST